MNTPTKTQNRLHDLFADARRTHAYKAQGASLEFTEDLVRLMQEQNVTNSELAVRIGTSPAYVTKILRGGTNFTLDTMVKIASMLGAEFRCHLQRLGTQTVWTDYTVGQSHRQSVTVPAAGDICEIVFTPTKLPKATAVSNESIPSAA